MSASAPGRPPAVSPGAGRLLVAGAALLWSTGGLAIKLVPLPAVGVAFWRSLLTALFLALVFRPAPRRLARVSPAAVVVYAAMIVSFISATKMTTAANAIFLQYTGPLYVLLLGPLVLKEPFRRADAIALAFSLFGMSLFFAGRLEPGALVGNLLGALSGVFFGLTILALRQAASRDPIATLISGNALAAIACLPFAVGRLALDRQGLLLVLFLGVVQMGVSYLLFVRGLTAVPAAEASLIGMLEPLFNPLWAFLGLGERPSGWALLGGAIVLLAVAARTLIPPGLAAAGRVR